MTGVENPELVEHVAKAIYQRPPANADWQYASDSSRDYCRADARAALKAIAAFQEGEA